MNTRWLSTALLITGVALLLASGGYFAVVAYARHEAAAFHSEELPLDERLPRLGEVPVITPGDEPATPRIYPPPERIEIPSIGVDSAVAPVGVVVNKDGELEWETPKNVVGHNAGTASPGEAGNMVLSGHISSPIRREGNVFNRLPDLRLGEPVLITTAEGTYTYQVVSRRVVEPTEVSVLDPTERPSLTLITCYPDLVYTHRLVLRAEPVSYQAGPAGQQPGP
jgi:sortase A